MISDYIRMFVMYLVIFSIITNFIIGAIGVTIYKTFYNLIVKIKKENYKGIASEYVAEISVFYFKASVAGYILLTYKIPFWKTDILIKIGLSLILSVVGGVMLYWLIIRFNSKLNKIGLFNYLIFSSPERLERWVRNKNMIRSVFLGPFFEEVMWRGFLLGLIPIVYGVNVYYAVAISSIFYGVTHVMQGVRGIFLNIINGLIFSLIAVYLGGILYSFVAHLVYNYLSMSTLHSYLSQPSSNKSS